MSASIPSRHRIVGALFAAGLLLALGVEARLRPDEPSVHTVSSGEGHLVRAHRPLMGTLFSVSIWTTAERKTRARRAIRETLDLARTIEDAISSWNAQSDTSRINRAAGSSSVSVGTHLRTVLAAALKWSRATGGAFDPTGGPLFELWEKARRDGALPDKAVLDEVLARVGWEQVEQAEEEVHLGRLGMRLGFGGIGKGYAADCMAKHLRGAGFSNFLIDAGGDLVIGGRKGAEPWKIAIRHPRTNGFLATFPATDSAVATSGDYERYMVIDGVRYSHIIDPRTGRPAAHLASVTVFASSGTDADALATAISVLGPEEGVRLADDVPGVDVLTADARGRIHFSAGLSLEGGRVEWRP